MPTLMLDTEGATADDIPTGTLKVAGYVTGSGAVPWTAQDWGLFPHSAHIRIDQRAGNHLGPHDSDVLDVEPGAAAPAEVPDWVKARIAAGITWSTIYASGGTWPNIKAALDSAGPRGWYYGHVNAWYADWNLNLAGATALLGHQTNGITIVAVQWASPTSNPNTIVPGGTLTLRQANVDISVTADDWFPAPGVTPPAALTGILIEPKTTGLYTGRDITSTDGGTTWK
jgi:hypothetical protein